MPWNAAKAKVRDIKQACPFCNDLSTFFRFNFGRYYYLRSTRVDLTHAPGCPSNVCEFFSRRRKHKPRLLGEISLLSWNEGR